MGIEESKIRRDPKIVIQEPLALLAAGFDMHESDRVKRNRAMQHWLEENATLFRAFVEQHPDAKLDPSDEDGMKKILEEIRTLH